MSAPDASDIDRDLVSGEDDRPRRRPRRCVTARAPRDRCDLIRFVVGPDDRLVFDLDERLPGRGLWLSADAESLKTALARNLFARAARRPVTVDADLPMRLVAQLRYRCLQRLGLARRAGVLEAGFEQVVAAARAGMIDVVVIARDAGADGRGKLVDGGRVAQRIELFSRSEMGAAIGREALVYAGLRHGAIADKLMADAGRLAGLLADTASVTTTSLEMIETA